MRTDTAPLASWLQCLGGNRGFNGGDSESFAFPRAFPPVQVWIWWIRWSLPFPKLFLLCRVDGRGLAGDVHRTTSWLGLNYGGQLPPFIGPVRTFKKLADQRFLKLSNPLRGMRVFRGSDPLAQTM